MEMPKVGKNKYVLIISNFETGVLLNNDGSNYLGTGNDYFQVVEGEGKAFEIARQIMKERRDIEVTVYDGAANFIKIFRP